MLEAACEVLTDLDVLSRAVDGAIFGETGIRWYNLDTTRFTASG